MIKDIIGFVTWKWTKFEIWQKFWFVNMFVFGIAVFSPSPYDVYLALLAMFMMVGLFVMLFIFPSIKSSWGKYKKEKYGLFETIKGSDQ